MPDRIRVTFDEDLRRNRAGAGFRLLLDVPAAVVVAAWTLLAALALPVAWAATLVRGIVPRPLHRFLCAYVRAWLRLCARLTLVFGQAEVNVSRTRQPRPTVFLRPALALPGLVLASALSVVLAGVSVAAWFTAITRGRTTEGLRELGAFCLRYDAETLAFVLLLTSRAPRLEARL